MYPIWRKQPGEDDVAYERFSKYYKKQIGTRSVLAAYNAYRLEKARKSKTEYSPVKAPASPWEKQHDRYRWEERAAAWMRKKLHDDDEYWEEKRRAWIDEEFKAAKKMLEKGLQIVAMPLVTQEVVNQYDDGRPVQITIIPNDKWSHRDSANMVKTASEIGRRALGIDSYDWMIEQLTAAGFVVTDPSKQVSEPEEIEDDGEEEYITITVNGLDTEEAEE